MRSPSPLYIEERHRALGRDATFSWSRALTHPPRCNRTRHRDRHLVSDFVGPPSWCRGGRHLGSDVMGPPSWTGSRGGRHLGSDVVTSLALKCHTYYCFNSHRFAFCSYWYVSVYRSFSERYNSLSRVRFKSLQCADVSYSSQNIAEMRLLIDLFR